MIDFHPDRSLIDIVTELQKAVADCDLRKSAPFAQGSRACELLAELHSRVQEIADEPLPIGTSSVSPIFKGNIVSFDANRLADRLGVDGSNDGRLK